MKQTEINEAHKDEFLKADKLWKLLEIALDDVEYCQKNGIEIEMDDWYKYNKADICSVCLAGAVLFRTVHLDHKSIFENKNISDALFKRIFILDDIRLGNRDDIKAGYKDLFGEVLSIELPIRIDSSNKGQLDYAKSLLPILKEANL